MREFAEAETLHRKNLARRRELFGDDHKDTVASLHNLGDCLLTQGKHAKAEPFLAEAARRAVDHFPPTNVALIKAIHGACVIKLEKKEQGERQLLASWKLLADDRATASMPLRQAVLSALIRFYESIDNEKAAADYRALRARRPGAVKNATQHK